MEIKDRWSLEVIFKSKKKTMKEAVLEAIEKMPTCVLPT